MDIFTAGGGEVAEEQNVNITGRVVRYLSFCSLFGMEATDETRSALTQEATDAANKAHEVQQMHRRTGVAPLSPLRTPPHALLLH